MKGYDIPTTGTTHDAVFGAEAIGIQGNVIPPQWLRHLVYPSGKPYMIAAFILSDIVYWYRPMVVRDETTGQVIGYRKKFKADKLQRSYKSFVDMYGFTKREVADACHYLKDKNLIDLDFRTIPYGETVLNNVLYIGLNHNSVKEITFNVIPSPVEMQEEIPQEVIGLTPKGETNTETTPKTTQKNGKSNDLPPQPTDKELPISPLTEEKPKPKTELFNYFTDYTKIPKPTNGEVRYWWSKVGIIYTLAGEDVPTGKRLIKQAVDKLREDELTIADPGSLIKTIRAQIANGAGKKVRMTAV